jgi:hypothetical protein
MDGFASDTIPASDDLPMAYWNIEGVLARIAAGEEPTCRRFVIPQGQIYEWSVEVRESADSMLRE